MKTKQAVRKNLRHAVIIYGPPGSGKGTQAELLVRKFGFLHFDTGRYLEELLHAPESRRDPVLTRERHLWDTGVLCSSSFVTKVVASEVRRIANAGFSVVLSGSPRTLYEAFQGPTTLGTRKLKGLMALLTALYGKEQVSIVELDINPDTSLNRNSKRRVCAECGLPMLGHVSHKPPHCVFCGGGMRRRILDDPKVIAVRLEEYRNRTVPILAELARQEYRVFPVNGESAPYIVSHIIARRLKLEKD